MPRGRKRRWWIKLWTKEWLSGTVRFQLTPEERSIWVDLLALAGESRQPGNIQSGEGFPFPHDYLANQFRVPLELLDKTMAKLEAQGRIQENEQGIRILNWSKYQTVERKTQLADLKPDKLTATELDELIRLYEENIGKATPVISRNLTEALEHYPSDWIMAAIEEAVEHGVRNYSYIRQILNRMERDYGEPKRGVHGDSEDLGH